MEYVPRRQSPPLDYVCLLDEAESGKNAVDPFFVYGALLVPLRSARRLHNRIVGIRERLSLPPDVALKWHMIRMENISEEEFAQAKSEAIQAIWETGGRLFFSLVHKRIAEKQLRKGKAHEFGAGTVLGSIGNHLSERRAFALFLFDRFPQMKSDRAHDFLGRWMSYGFGRAHDPATVPPSLGFGFVNSESTRLGSALDVALGVFVRCLTEETDPSLSRTGRSLIRLIARTRDETVWERGLMARPKEIQSQTYAEAYVRALGRLRRLGLVELSALSVKQDNSTGTNVIIV